MDYSIRNSVTIRDIYEGGQFLTPFPYSKMSNHIGVILSNLAMILIKIFEIWNEDRNKISDKEFT